MDPEAGADPGSGTERLGEARDILVAEGGSPIVAWEVPSVGAFQPGSPVLGDGTSLYEVGLALLQEAEL